MEPLKAPRTFKVYTVIKQTGLTMSYVYASMPNSLNFGSGFYGTLDEAEQARTFELLKETAEPKPKYHVFELEIPNPVYQE
jgi:hypothetical protein